MHTMTFILGTIKAAPNVETAAQLVALLPDNYFNGTATGDEMNSFCIFCVMFTSGKRNNAQRKLDKISALMKLGAFAKDGSAIKFTGLDKNIIIYQAAIRILEPRRINQNSFGLCGPSHFAVLVAKTKPETYVDLMISLLKNGAVNKNGWVFQVKKAILEYKIPANAIPQADWVFAASVRNEEDLPAPKIVPGIKDVIADQLIPSGAEGTYAATGPRMVFNWLRSAGYSHVIALVTSLEVENVAEKIAASLASDVNFEAYHPTKPEFLKTWPAKSILERAASIRIAEALCRSGWKVMLMVNEAWSVAAPSAEVKAPKPPAATASATTSAAAAAATPAAAAAASAVSTSAHAPPTPAASSAAADVKGVPPKTGVAATPVNPKLLDQPYMLPFVKGPKYNHWVLAKSIRIDHDTITVTLYTYGKKLTTAPLPLAIFTKNYGGFVAAFG